MRLKKARRCSKAPPRGESSPLRRASPSRDLRKSRGFTQVELAQLLGVIQSVVSSYERGRVRPHPDMLVKLAQAFDVTTDEILGRSKAQRGNGNRLDRRFVRRLQLVGKLPKRDQAALLRTIDAFLSRAG